MTANFFDLTYAHAVALWRAGDAVERDYQISAETLRQQRKDLLWVPPELRNAALQAIEASIANLKTLGRRSEALQRQALLASHRVSQRRWGVRLGQGYQFMTEEGNMRSQFVVDYLRPMPGEVAMGQPTILCAGEIEGRREMVILDNGLRAIEIAQGNLITLTNVFRRRLSA